MVWDTSLLTPVTAGRCVYRAIDADHIQGWDQTNGRWIIGKQALTVGQLSPGDESWHGASVFLEDLLASKCGAVQGQELVFLQAHTTQHACGPDWSGGIVARLDAGVLRALSFGVGESPGDEPCAVTSGAHASIWKDPVWNKQQAQAARNELLKLMGDIGNIAYESPARQHQRISAGRNSGPPHPQRTP